MINAVRTLALIGAVLLSACGSSSPPGDGAPAGADEGPSLGDGHDTAGRTWDTRLVHIIDGDTLSLAVEPDGSHRIAYIPRFTREVRTLSSADDIGLEPSRIASYCDAPSIAARPTTRSAVVCLRSPMLDDRGFEIHVVRLYDPLVRVTRAPTVAKASPRAAFDSTGMLHIVYAERDPVSGYGVGYASLAKDDITTTYVQVATGLADRTDYNVALTITPDDAVHVVYGVFEHGVHYVRRDPNGTWGADELISEPDADARRVTIAFDDTGTLHVLYRDHHDGDARFRYNRRTSGGWLGPQTVAFGEGSFNSHSIHVRPDGRVSIAFTRRLDDDDNKSDLWFVAGRDGVFERPGVVAAVAKSFLDDPIVTTDPAGDLLVLHSEIGTSARLRFARLVP